MIYSNSIKILFNNFILAFKSLIYKFVALLISCATAFAIAFKPLQILSHNGVFVELWKGLSQFSFFKFFKSIITVENLLINTIKNSSTNVLISLIFAVAVGYFLFMTLCNFDKVPLCEILDGKMSSNCKLNFIGTFFSRLWFSFKYTVTSIIFILPFDLFIIISTYFSIRLFTLSGLWLTLAPFIVILMLIILFSLRLTLFCNWVPNAVSSGKGVWKSFGCSTKITYDKFFRTFGNSVLIVLTMFFFNMMMFILTAGVGLILTVPASVLLINSFSMVNYYVCTGNRFYVDAQTIISPKKLEVEENVNNLIDLV